MSVYYKNIRDVHVVRQSERINSGETYLIPNDNLLSWGADADVLADIVNGFAQIGDGTQFFTDIDEALSHLRGLKEVQISSVHTGVTLPQQIVNFQDLSGYNVFHKGYLFTAVANDVTEHEACYAQMMKLQGIRFRIDGNASLGDYMEVELVDSDGVYYPAGTVLAKFAETVYVWPYIEFERICEDAKDLPPNIYIRCRYVNSNDVVVKVILEHILRTVPS